MWARLAGIANGNIACPKNGMEEEKKGCRFRNQDGNPTTERNTAPFKVEMESRVSYRLQHTVHFQFFLFALAIGRYNRSHITAVRKDRRARTDGNKKRDIMGIYIYIYERGAVRGHLNHNVFPEPTPLTMQYLTDMVVKQASQFVFLFAHKAKSQYNLPSPKNGSFLFDVCSVFIFSAFFKIRGISTGGEMIQCLRAIIGGGGLEWI